MLTSAMFSRIDDVVITSDQNPVVKLAYMLLRQSRQRKKHGKTVLEGTHLLDALINSGHRQLKNVQLLLAQHALQHLLFRWIKQKR